MCADTSNLPPDALPISDFYTLLDSRTYIRKEKRIVALCALESRHGFRELKFYEWVWRGEGKGWKVGLANMNIQDVNLKRLAEDAENLSKNHNIQLKWK
jgi:hypothetical protein